MSSPYHSPAELPRTAGLADIVADFTLPPLSSWPHPYTHHDSFSSPPRSSSPPTTPYNTKRTYDYAHIQSSPTMGLGADFRTSSDQFQDSHSSWHRYSAPRIPPKTQPRRSTSFMSRSAFMYQQRYAAASDFDASDYSEGMDTDFDDSRPDLPARTRQRPLTPLSDTQDNEVDDGPGFSLRELGIRTMCFRTSAERGRWKTDPMPYQHSLLSTRKSAPATDSIADVLITSRPISEPAPSIPASVVPSRPPEPDKQSESVVPEVTSAPSPATQPSLPSSPTLGFMEPLPPLTSDRDSSMDVDEVLTPSSPLPPSSPPPFSPAVSLAPLPPASISPDNSCPSSPLVAPSSPLSPISSEIGEEDVQELIFTTQAVVAQEVEDGSNPDEVGANSDLDSTPRPHDHSTHASLQSSIIKPDLSQSATQIIGSLESLPSAPKIVESFSEASAPYPIAQSSTSQDARAHYPNFTPPPLPKAEDLLSQSPTSKDSLHSSSAAATAEITTTLNKRPILSLDSTCVDGPARKRVKASDGASQNIGASSPRELHEEQRPKAGIKKRHKNPATSEIFNSTSISERKRLSKYTIDDSDSESSATSSSSSSSRASSIPPPRLTFSDGISRDRNGIAEADAEICGMIIEGMATSRASSLPISQICKVVLQTRPSMKAERDEEEWRDVFGRVLQSGVTGRGSGVFGKVDSSYKDETKSAAEARWFYVPELDCDQERAALIRSMMPRPGKRSVTKKYKQYYYQPLDKISRWDPEDDL